MEQFEKNIKRELENRRNQPSDQAWEKLELMLNEQDEKKVKKLPKTYLFIAASIFVLMCLGTFFLKMTSENVESNAIDLNLKESLVNEEDVILNENQFPTEENTPPISKEIQTTPNTNKALVSFSKEEKKQIEFKETEINVSKEIVSEKNMINEMSEIVQIKKEDYQPKTDPNRLLMVAEYERNVEKSASQFKQMKEKFQEVKTVLNNINQ